MTTHRISGGGVTATIAVRGAEPHSLTGPDGHEYLWQAGPQWRRHAPILFPLVGRVPDDTISVDGVTYPLGQHGFARDLDWTVTDIAEDSIALRLTDSPETRARYPFSFELAVVYSVGAEGLTTTFVVQNTGEVPLPYSLGSHPAFAWPLEPGVAQTDHIVEFSDDEPHPIRRLDATLLRPDPVATPVSGRTLRLDPALFAEDAVVLDRVVSRTMVYRAPSGRGLRLFRDAAFSTIVIWSPPAGAPFLCLEPCTGPAAPIGSSGDLATRPDVELLAPGDLRAYAYSLSPITPQGAPGESAGFNPEVVSAVLAHMNDDHTGDSLRIVRAFAEPDATAAVMSGLDTDAGVWTATVGGTSRTVRIPWTLPVVERMDLRRAVVALHDAASERLGLPPQAH